MGRGLDGYLLLTPLRPCAVFKLHRALRLAKFWWRIASGRHLFPFRTEQLSHSAPMVLGGQPPGRVGRRRFFIQQSSPTSVGLVAFSGARETRLFPRFAGTLRGTAPVVAGTGGGRRSSSPCGPPPAPGSRSPCRAARPPALRWSRSARRRRRCHGRGGSEAGGRRCARGRRGSPNRRRSGRLSPTPPAPRRFPDSRSRSR